MTVTQTQAMLAALVSANKRPSESGIFGSEADMQFGAVTVTTPGVFTIAFKDGTTRTVTVT